MNRSLALLLQVIVALVGLAVLTFLLGEPHFEGRNVHATTFEIYFHDPFLAYVYVGSIPFFIALWQAFKLLADFRRSQAFSHGTVRAMGTIKRCAITLVGFVAGATIFILMCGDKDDRPAGVVMSALATFAAVTIAIAAAMFERNLRNALAGREASQA